MKKRDRILLAMAIAVLLVVLAWQVLRDRSQVQVFGNLPPGELAQIQRVVRHEIWRGAFPDFSLRTVRRLPGAVKSRRGKRVVRVESWSAGRVRVTLGVTGQTNVLVPEQYTLRNRPKGWEIAPDFWDFDRGIGIRSR